jgi:putative transposase
LTPAGRATPRSLLNHPNHVDKAPATVYHEPLDLLGLLGEGAYVASVSTMYRVPR